MRISEQFVSVPLVEAKDYGSVGVDFDSVHMGKLSSLSAFLVFGAITGNSILKVALGATAGTKTTDIAFNYRLGAGVFKATNADQFGDPIAVLSTGLTLTGATFTHKQVAIEIDSDTVLEGKPWVTIYVDATATVLLLGAVGIGMARYPGHLIPTVI